MAARFAASGGRVEPQRGVYTVQVEQENQSSSRAMRKDTFLDEGCCDNSLFHSFIAINDETFTFEAKAITVYGIILTLCRWMFGLWAVVTLPALCCISGIYCIVKAVKETAFWIVVLYVHNKPVNLSDKGFFRYHVYLLTDFLVSVALFGIGTGLEAGVGIKECEFLDSPVWRLAVAWMSMDAFIPHIAIGVLIIVCVIFVKFEEKTGFFECLLNFC
ncbi:uncharacterized protein LOC128232812 [Mya arenaria]|uniref:uncharacterized protein LOC128232812 n=1 Tax=Mya arenaria TaxID=6604 RepID=UPI0022E40C5F|nr:uncharacterized protein LOC128232812 [Mya arenaria]